MNVPRLCIERLARACGRPVRLLCASALAFSALACAAARPPDAARPRGDESPYPVPLAADAERRAQALANWATLARESGLAPNPSAPELQPVTATVRALPPAATDALRLPLVEISNGGETKRAGQEGADEATREALRRFITSARDLLGVRLEDLSLTEVTDEAGVRVARYRQRPFPYPLRGGYGIVEIRFNADRRVMALTSTALPDVERLGRALANLRPRQIPAEQIAQRLAGRPFSYQTAAGQQTHTVAAGEPVAVRQLVIYPVPIAGDTGTLGLRLTWEVAVAGGGILVYVDAVTGEIIAATAQESALRASA